jgi:hypothetical protein
MSVLAGIAGFGAGVVFYLVGRHVVRRMRSAPNWLLGMTGGVPWAEPRAITALGEAHGLQPLYWVSRHDLAECGITCPRCGALAAAQGDDTMVRRMLVNGRENEVIKCLNSVENEDGSKRVCNAILVASPDTEHGDETTEGDPDDFYRFCRTTAERVLRDRYGIDAVSQDHDGNVAVSKPRHGDGTPIAPATVAAITAGMADSAAGRVTERDFTAHADESIDYPKPKDN